MKKIIVLLFCLGVIVSVTSAQTVGLFNKQADWTIGDPPTKTPGEAKISGDVYTLIGNGDDIWDAEDEGFFLYTEKEGSWTLTAKVQWIDTGSDVWSKAGLMIRSNPNAANSANFMWRHRGNNYAPDITGSQWRLTAGAPSASLDFTDAAGNNIGDPNMEGIWARVAYNAPLGVCYAWYSTNGTNWVLGNTIAVNLGTKPAYGLVITSHTADEVLVEANFSQVVFTEGAPTAAKRTLPKERISGNDLVDIKIEVGNPNPTTQSITVNEDVPNGWAVTEISNGGTFANGVITWKLDAAPGVTTLTYKGRPEIDAAIFWGGTVNNANIAGDNTIIFLRARTPVKTGWNEPAGGWLYIFDPDLGSDPDLEKDGWKHNNGSDSYAYQPKIPAGPNAGKIWHNPGLIDDEEGGKCLVIYDPGDPRSMEAYGNIPDPGLRKVTINYDLGPVTKAVAAFRVRSKAFTDEFGVAIPFGYSEQEGYNLLGLMKNENMLDLNNWEALTASGLFFSPDFPDSLNFPTYSEYPGHAVPGSYEENWDHTVWHEYWITWNITPGAKSTALYVDGELQPKFSYPKDPNDEAEKAGAFFNRVRDNENDIPVGNAMFRISFRQTGQSGNLQFDYICFKPGTDEPPKKYVEVSDWQLY